MADIRAVAGTAVLRIFTAADVDQNASQLKQMQGLVLGSIALIAISVSIPAHAADMAVKAPPPTVSVAPYNWSGLYVGGNFGGAWTSGNLNIPGNNFYGGLTEFIGGVQVGYNFQAGNFLYGIEGDFDWATFWSDGRYGAYYNLETWRQFVSLAGFTELTHYYRPV